MPRAMILGAVLTGLCLLTLGADKKTPPKALFGAVRKVEKKGELLEIKAQRHGKVRVLLDKKAVVTVHKLVPLSEIDLGTHLYVLGRFTDASPGARGGEHPPTMTGITAIVAAGKKDFVPPPIPAKLKERRSEWRKGKLSKHQNDLYLEGGPMLPVGGTTPVIVLVAGTKESLAKKQTVVVFGRGQFDDPKDKEFKADEIAIMAAGVKNKETYPAVLDFTGEIRPSGRQPKPEKGKSKGRPDF